MSFYKLLTLFISVLLMSSKHSFANSFPRGCELAGFEFNNNHLLVNETGEQAFYLIQNHANTMIELKRLETQEAFMSPTLTARLDPLNWGAFASDVKELRFECFTKQNEGLHAINCGDVLDVCQYPRAKFALSNMGNYWVAINQSQEAVIKEAIHKGIYLRW